MKRICLCVNIHIPHILPERKAYTREGDTNNNHIIREEITVKKVASENILPFFQFIRRINSFFDEKITFGISVSGIALTLLQKYTPEVIGCLSALKKSNYIELFSETWSHSAVACFNPHSFRRQVHMHDRLMEFYFGEVPQLLYVNSPVYPDNFIDTISGLGKKAVFINSNMLDESIFRKFQATGEKSEGTFLVFPIDYKMSQLLQDLDFNLLQQKAPFFSRGIFRRFKKQVYENYPAIVNCNLTRTKCFFHLSRSLTWEKFIREMVNDNNTAFISPTEMLHAKNTAGLKESDFSEILLRAKLYDVWIQNGYQAEAFKKQLTIDAGLNTKNPDALLREWDFLQDMDYLYFMNDNFVRKKYTTFNPFPGPVDAYENYMETLNNFSDKIQSRAPFKTGISKDKLKVNKEINQESEQNKSEIKQVKYQSARLN